MMVCAAISAADFPKKGIVTVRTLVKGVQDLPSDKRSKVAAEAIEITGKSDGWDAVCNKITTIYKNVI